MSQLLFSCCYLAGPYHTGQTILDIAFDNTSQYIGKILSILDKKYWT